ncbi:MAG: cyanophycinase [Polyangia bacterium]
MRKKGPLILVGGNEDKQKERKILAAVASEIGDGHLLLITAATNLPDEVADEYRRLFRELGVRHIEPVDVRRREQGYDEALLKKVGGAAGAFITGGDQLRLTSQLGGTPLLTALRSLHDSGGLLAGTSAGAAAMPDAMLIAGASDRSYQLHDLTMSAGLGVLCCVTVDTHFSQRGRISRLIGAATQNPEILGLGIDEDTAVVIRRGGEQFHVLGAGAVYVVDGTDISFSSLAERHPEGIVTVHDVRLHVLGEGQGFDLSQRRPVVRSG